MMFKKNLLSVIIIVLLILSIFLSVNYIGNSTTQSIDDENIISTSSISYNQNISDIITQVNSTRLTGYIEKLQKFKTRYAGTEGNENATKWIKNKLESFGVDTHLQNFTFDKMEMSNVIGVQKGVDPNRKDNTIIISGHLDSIVSSSNKTEWAPGADDDASGIAATLESARILSKYNFSKTIMYCAWNAEERGLVGSSYFVNSIDPEEMKIDAMYQYDMIGYTSGENIVNIHADSNSASLLDHMVSVNNIYNNNLSINSVYNSSLKASDHSPFWKEGYKATLTIEKEFSPYYHTANDTLSHISSSILKSVTKLAIGSAAHSGKLITPDPVTFYLSNPTLGSLYSGGQLLDIEWFVSHKSWSSDDIKVEITYSSNYHSGTIGSFKDSYKKRWKVPEINSDVTLYVKAISPNNTTIMIRNTTFSVDSIHPYIISTKPPDLDEPIGHSIENLSFKFSEKIAPDSVNKDNIFLTPDIDYYDLQLSRDTKILDILPFNLLKENTSYTLNICNLTDKAGNKIDKNYSYTFYVTNNMEPDVDFSLSSEVLEVLEPVKFVSNAEDLDGTVDKYRWEVESLGEYYGEELEVTFKEGGYYSINLTVWDDYNSSSSFNKTIFIEDTIGGVITTKPDNPNTKDEIDISFDCDSDIDPVGFTWSLGDGTLKNDKNIEYRYEKPGSYDIILDIELKGGQVYRCSKKIDVSNVLPEANFTMEISEDSSKTVILNSKSSDYEGDITNLTWYFGDGSKGYGDIVEHEYTENGEYSVILEVTDENGGSATIEKQIKIDGSERSDGSTNWIALPIFIILLTMLTLMKRR